MSDRSSLLDRVLALPRSMRWLVFAGTFVVLFLLWDATIGPVVSDWNDAADSIQSQVRAVRNADEMRDKLDDVEEAMVALGPVQPPGRESQGRAALNNAVVEVLKNYSVTDDSFDLSGGSDKLSQDVSAGIVSAGSRLARLTGTLKFESSPEDAIAIIADFERRHDVETVSKVRIVTSDRRRVKVNLTLEAWAEIAGSRRR